MRVIIALLAVVMLTSCTSAQFTKRAEHRVEFIEKYPDLSWGTKAGIRMGSPHKGMSEWEVWACLGGRGNGLATENVYGDMTQIVRRGPDVTQYYYIKDHVMVDYARVTHYR